jgi:oligosaccharide repeat unit polymerase
LQIRVLKGEAKPIDKVLFGYVFVGAFLLAVLTTGRGPIVQIFMLLGIVYILLGTRRNLKQRIGWALGAVVVVAFFVFWIMGSAMGKTGDTAAEAALDIVEYQFSAIPALSDYLGQHTIPFFYGDLGQNTFRFILAFLASLGLVDQPPNLVQEFVAVPNLTNIYTIYYFYLKDFGWVGLVVFPLFLGFLHGHIFRWAMACNTNDFALYVLAFSYLPLVQSTGGEVYFTHLSTWIQLLLVGLVMTRAHRIQD